MPTELRGVVKTATFNVVDEPRMESLLGSDAKMWPYEAVLSFTDGKLTQIEVSGWIIGAKGNRTRQTHWVTFGRTDLGLDPDPEADNHDDDWVPLAIPGWVAELAAIGVAAERL